jgi:hypothetical protein
MTTPLYKEVLMFASWRNRKIGFKLLTAFAFVIFLFVAALVAVYTIDTQADTMQSFQDARLLPAQTAMLQLRYVLRRLDDDGAYGVQSVGELPRLKSRPRSLVCSDEHYRSRRFARA